MPTSVPFQMQLLLFRFGVENNGRMRSVVFQALILKMVANGNFHKLIALGLNIPQAALHDSDLVRILQALLQTG